MKRYAIVLSVVLALLFFPCLLLAAAPHLAGGWLGSAKGIGSDGKTARSFVQCNVEKQEGDLLCGKLVFTHYDTGKVCQCTFTGYVSQNNHIRLLLTSENADFGKGTVEAECNGKLITGIFCDSCNSSTRYVVLERLRECRNEMFSPDWAAWPAPGRCVSPDSLPEIPSVFPPQKRKGSPARLPL